MPDHFERRAREPVAHCLNRRLVVPRVYFEAKWPREESATYDLLVLDRDGNGDAHVVRIRKVASKALAEVPTLFEVDAPYRWVAFLRGTEDENALTELAKKDVLYAKDSAGRIGVIEVVTMADGDLGANVLIAAERFPGAFYDLSTAFSGSHKADMEIS